MVKVAADANIRPRKVVSGSTVVFSAQPLPALTLDFPDTFI